MRHYLHAFFNEPIKAYAKEDVFYNEDPNKNDILSVELLGVSSYKGEAITFITKITDKNKPCRDGSLFFYVPPHKVTKKDFKYNLKDLVYENCPSYGEFFLTKVEHLDECNVYIKNKDIWVPGKPLYFVDWAEDNVLLIMVELDNCQFAFMPPHKIKFSSEKEFCDFKKMRSIWKV